ncbi:MAG: metallophosphoesterase [Lacibacter sp.]
MQRFAGSWIFLLVVVLVDWYVFQALKSVAYNWAPRTRWTVYALYWSVSVMALGLILSLTYTSYETWHRLLRTYVFATITGLFFAKILASMFFLVDDVRRLFQWIAGLVLPEIRPATAGGNGGITRSVFLSWMGLVTGGSLFGTLLYGFGNKYRYQLKKVLLNDAGIPEAFKGFRIIHISDIHSGSFTDRAAVQRGIDLINRQQPDLIVFTGDLVNYAAEEMEEYVAMFRTLNARCGVYATLGNHDYGFPRGNSREAVREAQLRNAEAVKEMHRRLGWKTLSNTHDLIEVNGQQIALLGVDNISAKANFPSFGNLQAAYAGTAHVPFKILLSHDPSHWNAEVTSRFTDINLTLSGHTHGMQFGVEVPGFRWSPVKYVYRQWAGLYEEGNQKLYVNRGFGFIGYPGRVGILPEVTLIELA